MLSECDENNNNGINYYENSNAEADNDERLYEKSTSGLIRDNDFN